MCNNKAVTRADAEDEEHGYHLMDKFVMESDLQSTEGSNFECKHWAGYYDWCVWPLADNSVIKFSHHMHIPRIGCQAGITRQSSSKESLNQ